MLFTPRIATKPLTEFLRRLGISLEAGIDIRKTLANEAKRSSPALRQRVESISAAVNQGSSLTEALNSTGEYFPILVRELIHVGEQTGHLPEVLKQLVTHYEAQLALKRSFLNTIAWPMVQLGMALLLFGFMIWISAVIERMTGSKTDILGIGLTGEVGLLIYLAILGVVFGSIYLTYRAAIAGKVWTAPVQRLVLKLPVLGQTIRTLSVARFAWTLQLTMGAAIDVKHALELSLASTHNIEFIEQKSYVNEMIQQGQSIHETLAGTGVFPTELINAVQVGEESGRLVETLSILAKQQLDSARIAFAVLTKIAGYIVWFLVAALLIAAIFHEFSVYVNTITEFAKPMK